MSAMQQQTPLLESGGGLSEVESIVPLAVCEFERDLSALVGISLRRVLCTCIAM